MSKPRPPRRKSGSAILCTGAIGPDRRLAFPRVGLLFVVGVFLAGAVSACTGSTSSVPLPAPSSAPAPVRQGSATFHISGVFPTVNSLTIARLNPDESRDTAFPTNVVNVRGVGVCSAPIADGSKSCTVTIRAPFGTDTFDVAAYSSADGSGPPLAAGTVAATIGAAVAPTTEVALLGVIASIAFDRPRTVFAADGALHSATLRWLAKDAAGSFVVPSAASMQALLVSAANDPGNALGISRATNLPSVTVTYDASRTLVDATVTATLPSGLTATTDVVSLRYQPRSLAVVVNGPPAAVTIAESGTLGPFTATSSNAGIAAVSASASAAQSGGSATLNVTAGTQAGAATIVVTDPSGTVVTLGVQSNSSGAAVVIPGALSLSHFSAGISSTAVLGEMTAGPDANIWFSEGNAIGKVSSSGAIVEITGSFSSNIAGITAGPDGNIWFSETDIDDVGSVSPTDSSVRHFSLSGGDAPAGIVAGRDGALWVADSGSDRIGRVTSNGIYAQTYALSAGAAPLAIVAGPDGNLWFTEPGINGIGRLTTSGVLTEFSAGISPGAGIAGIAAGNDGNVWFTERTADRIAKITMAGNVTEFAAGLTASAAPQGIVGGADGNLWFTEGAGGRLGRITPRGVINEFALGGATPAWIARADDGSLWFTQTSPPALGRART